MARHPIRGGRLGRMPLDEARAGRHFGRGQQEFSTENPETPSTVAPAVAECTGENLLRQ